MILPAKQEKEIIDGILPLLIPVLEETDRVLTVVGRDLIYQGITKTKDGAQVLPGKEYVINETIKVQVNHRRRLKNVIQRAQTMAGMMEDLSRYLVKFGQSKEAITNSINSPLKPPSK